ncbi:MAG: RNA-directed DNA polymerase [Planctomycetes bacterium]|nr:RNA-directed DNA polymerase [Planctomycetota bacterium]
MTDITNYFDSISHQLLLEYLAPLGLPRKAVGLLGRLLEALKPSAGHSPNPGIGIPVDEYDCSRQLAHVFLFEHDRRIVEMVGETNYARWMDDQNIGAESPASARRLVNSLTRSLSSQRLTLNASKTVFLSPNEVAKHFHLEANERITQWEEMYAKNRSATLSGGQEAFEALWGKVSNLPTAGEGHWDKILKRLYGLAPKVSSAVMDHRMRSDLVEYPHLDARIFHSLASRNEGQKLLNLFEDYRVSGECLFEATEANFFEACLLLDASRALASRIRSMAKTFVRGTAKGHSKNAYGKASAVICLYWFGLSATTLMKLFSEEEARLLPPSVARAWLACVAAKDADSLPVVQAKLIGHPSEDVAKLSRFLGDLLKGTVDQIGNYKNQRTRWPRAGRYYDVRAWLQLELISQTRSRKLKSTAQSDCKVFARFARTRQEKVRLAKINSKLK